MFFNSLYSINCFTEIQILIISIKKVLPLLVTIIKTKSEVLCIGTNFLYSKITSSKRFLIHQLTSSNVGIFSNFSITSFYSLYHISLKNLPKILIFFYLNENESLVKEAKLKNIPIIGLISSKENSYLIDYPIIIGSSYFSTIYFFSLFFFRFLRVH